MWSVAGLFLACFAPRRTALSACFYWRKLRDSNPGTLAGCWFSRPVQSTTLPSFLVPTYNKFQDRWIKPLSHASELNIILRECSATASGQCLTGTAGVPIKAAPAAARAGLLYLRRAAVPRSANPAGSGRCGPTARCRRSGHRAHPERGRALRCARVLLPRRVIS